jgi:hypothetical protein
MYLLIEALQFQDLILKLCYLWNLHNYQEAIQELKYSTQELQGNKLEILEW